MNDPTAARILLFSTFRDLVGREEMDWSIPQEGISLGSLVEAIHAAYPPLARWDGKTLLAVNCEYADPDSVVKPGDEVALMPPVQGG